MLCKETMRGMKQRKELMKKLKNTFSKLKNLKIRDNKNKML